MMNFSRSLFATSFLLFIILEFGHAKPLDNESAMDEAQADFALNLLRTAANSDESVVLSPFSIAVALSMPYVGAEGKTKEEMNNVLAKGQDGQQLNEYFFTLMNNIANKGKGYTLDTANRLYIQQDFALKEAYLNIIQSHYKGQLQQVDFSQAVSVAEEINKWVEQQTHDKIKNLVSPTDMGFGTRLALINAVYFKGNWVTPFKKEMTKKMTFHSRQPREVEMMAIKDDFPYYENEDVQVLGLPYIGREVQMFIVLPRKQLGLADVEKELTGKKLLSYIANCRSIEVQVKIPKFKMEKKVELVDTLRKLGMSDAFTDTANFTGITDVPLKIGAVIHKAFIEANEKGTEAAAASAIEMRLRSAPIMLPPPKKFHADHPFLYVITWRSSILLFSGRMA